MQSSSPVTSGEPNVREECVDPVCYTPERLIRSQEYRILIPSPRRYVSSQARFTPENEGGEWRSCRCRKRLSRLIDSRQIGTQSEVFFSLIPRPLLFVRSKSEKRSAEEARLAPRTGPEQSHLVELVGHGGT